MKQKVKKTKSKVSFKSKVAIVVSRYNKEVCDGLLWGAKKVLSESGLSEKSVDVFEVPGAYEIVLAVSSLAQKKKYDGVVCLGCVLKGETPHFDYISQAVSHFLCEVSLKTGKPVGFGVITPNTQQQAVERSSQDDYNKGAEAAMAVVEMIGFLKKV